MEEGEEDFGERLADPELVEPSPDELAPIEGKEREFEELSFDHFDMNPAGDDMSEFGTPPSDAALGELGDKEDLPFDQPLELGTEEMPEYVEDPDIEEEDSDDDSVPEVTLEEIDPTIDSDAPRELPANAGSARPTAEAPARDEGPMEAERAQAPSAAAGPETFDPLGDRTVGLLQYLRSLADSLPEREKAELARSGFKDSIDRIIGRIKLRRELPGAAKLSPPEPLGLLARSELLARRRGKPATASSPAPKEIMGIKVSPKMAKLIEIARKEKADGRE
jgi:hypothetical protein